MNAELLSGLISRVRRRLAAELYAPERPREFALCAMTRSHKAKRSENGPMGHRLGKDSKRQVSALKWLHKPAPLGGTQTEKVGGLRPLAKSRK